MINYDLDNQLLITYKKNKRVAITGARDGLNGYQKGQCFYCFKKISIKPKSADLSDVDHFFPLYLEKNNIYVKIKDIVRSMLKSMVNMLSKRRKLLATLQKICM